MAPLRARSGRRGAPDDHRCPTSTGPFLFTIHDRATSLALKIGGGIDVRISPRVDLRVVEINYEPIFAKDRNTPVSALFEQRVKGKTAQNMTLSFGIVWH